MIALAVALAFSFASGIAIISAFEYRYGELTRRSFRRTLFIAFAAHVIVPAWLGLLFLLMRWAS